MIDATYFYMPIPKLNQRGYLPVGIHTCTLEEIRKRFGTFTNSDHRVQLFDKLLELIANAKATNAVDEVIINGSFTTAKEKPNDIDLILVLKDSVMLNPNVELSPSHYNALSKRQLRKNYGFDVFVDNKNGDVYNFFLDWFQKTKNSDDRKGVLRLQL